MARTVLDKETRREQLLEAAIKVFARHGYRSTSIDDIIKEANVARGTFYLYFEGKKEIFLAVIDYYFEKLQALFEETSQKKITPKNYRQQLREILMTRLGFFVQHRDLAKIIFREASSIDEAFERRWYALKDVMKEVSGANIQQLQKAGCLRRTISPEAFCLFMPGMFHETVCGYILRTEEPDLEWLVDQWMEFVLRGIEAR
ncbi:TetR/AcrR family transcriptional regulator [Candidatus Acetothermia bacterium]|nr:TetR/AcrR family transcriptional regulator [Candidatus Acetothermia bacterium]MBI3661204.1 TetR/AcrR family transcriptional regulator [Candidatus Acetothermia bacterium]